MGSFWRANGDRGFIAFVHFRSALHSVVRIKTAYTLAFIPSVARRFTISRYSTLLFIVFFISIFMSIQKQRGYNLYK